MKKSIKPFSSPLAATVFAFAVSNHRVVENNVESTLAFFGADGREITSRRESLTTEQYANWTHAIKDDDAYFFDCHLKNCGFEVEPEKPAAPKKPATPAPKPAPAVAPAKA